MAQKHVEVERKYDAAPDFVVPDLTGLPGVAAVSAPETHQLLANYFDTDDLRLAARGITLRRRRGGTDAGWHLKIPSGPDSKDELRAPLGRAQVVPARLAGLVSAYTRGAELRSVAKMETARTVVRLLDDQGRELAEVADDAVAGEVIDRVIEGHSVTAWREIEVELAGGSTELLKAAGRALRRAGARRAATSSKLGRLLDGAIEPPEQPEQAEQAEQAERAPQGREDGDGRAAPETAGAAVLAYLSAQVRALLTYDPKARLAEFDAVHKMRVASRRLRSTLRSYAAVLDRESTDALQPELKWLADALGEVRDLEVLRMRFTERIDRLDELSRPQRSEDRPSEPARARGAPPAPAGLNRSASRHADRPAPPLLARGWLADLEKQEAAAYRRLNAALKQPRYFALLDAVEALLAEPTLTDRAARPAAKELPRQVNRAWRRLEKAYAAIDGADDRDAARHEARKVGKRARYAAEVAVPTLGRPAATVVTDAKNMQEVLGGFQDGVVAMAYLRSAAARVTDPAEAFALGTLHGEEHCAAENSLTMIESTWRHTTGPTF